MNQENQGGKRKDADRAANMEVCVDSIESALAAARGGASRLEVCSSLSEGGLTPSTGLLRVITENVAIPAFAMVRPRGGDFVYTRLEQEVMARDIESLLECGARGLVFGCLTTEGELDCPALKTLIGLARRKKPGIDLTLHRAIDLTRDIKASAQRAAELGFTRVLTSGGAASALLGAATIAELVRDLEMNVMPGGGISEENMAEVMETTRAVEYHASARERRDSLMEWRNPACILGTDSTEYSCLVTSTARVEKLVRVYKDNIFNTRNEMASIKSIK